MSLEIQLFSELPAAQQAEVAQFLSAYTHGELGETPQMLPVSAADIYSKHVGVVALQSGVAVGYVGAITPEAWNGKPMSEVGSLMVLPDSRRQGIGHQLVRAVSHRLAGAGALPYAFCNPLSKRIFAENGYHLAAAAEVPSSAFGACATCPCQPVSGCCDEVLIYGGQL